MRRAAGYLIAWCGATALAVGVSWLGVRDVLRSAITDESPLAPVVAVAAPVTASPSAVPPGAVPPGAVSPGAVSPGTTAPSRTARASPAARPSRSAGSTGSSSSTGSAGAAQPSPTSRSGQSTGGETLHTFTLRGGRATIAVTSRDCRVVTATPNDGYEVKIWETAQWLRVAFLRDTRESSAFCTWNALPPRLDTYEN